MSQFHLRPVQIQDHSPTSSSSPTASTSSPRRPSPNKSSPVSATTPHHPHHHPRQRRPLSPSSIRDLDLTRSSDMPHRKYPAPPTGHELMAMFPPAPPETPLETRGGPTSGFFQLQERAFFAQAGKEIFRVRVEIDSAMDVDTTGHASKPQQRSTRVDGPNTSAPRSWPPQLPAHPPPNASVAHHHHPTNRSPVPALSSNTPVPRPNNQRGSVPVPLYSPPTTTTSHPPPPPLPPQPPNLHASPLHQPGMALRTSPQEAAAVSQRPKTEFPPEEFDADEAWRRPIPYAERRRAGKHTRRVIVR